MAAQADAFFPITVSIFADGCSSAHYLSSRFPVRPSLELFFTTPYSHWFHPLTGKPEFPLAWCPRCQQECVVFRMMELEQPSAPGPIFLARTECCDVCVPRTTKHLVVDADGQVIRFRRFFYANGEPILVKDPKSKETHGTDEMEFRIHDKEDFLSGDSFRLRVTTQPYKNRSTSKQGVPYAGSRP